MVPEEEAPLRKGKDGGRMRRKEPLLHVCLIPRAISLHPFFRPISFPLLLNNPHHNGASFRPLADGELSKRWACCHRLPLCQHPNTPRPNHLAGMLMCGAPGVAHRDANLQPGPNRGRVQKMTPGSCQFEGVTGR